MPTTSSTPIAAVKPSLVPMPKLSRAIYASPELVPSSWRLDDKFSMNGRHRRITGSPLNVAALLQITNDRFAGRLGRCRRRIDRKFRRQRRLIGLVDAGEVGQFAGARPAVQAFRIAAL